MPELLSTSVVFLTKIGAPTVSVVHFAADFAEQCKHVDDVLDTLSKQSAFTNVKFYKCQAEDLADISLKFKIDAVPAVLLFKNSKQIDRIDGADVAKITAKVKQHCQNAQQNEGDFENRLKSLINRQKVMLFMKGDRNVPRCGFSRQIIEILNGTGVSYDTFDILSDEEVRQGLKLYSDWPTYPQLYVNGELVGGLDIVKELIASGELSSTLNS